MRICYLILLLPLALTAATPLLDPAPKLAPTSKEVSAKPANGGIGIRITPGKEHYPGLRLTPAKPWDLAAHGELAATLTNKGRHRITVVLRVDNKDRSSKSPWNVEQLHLDPGATGTLKVRFGYSWGQPDYQLDASRVASVLLYVTKPQQPVELQLTQLEARGPSAAAAEMLHRPRNGKLFGPGAPQLDADRLRGTGATPKLQTQGEQQRLTIAFERDDGVAVIDAPAGHWDFRDHLQLRATIRNRGTTTISPKLRLRTKGADLPWSSTDAIAANATGELILNWTTTELWHAEKAKAPAFQSDHVSAVELAADAGTQLELVALTAEVPAAAKLPDWLGQRPPVDGDWRISFEDNFDHSWLDTDLWSPRGSNYWDKKSHFSPAQVRLGNGLARLRFERKTGRHNDDHLGVETDYATGFLHTWDRFAQQYGYFECRMKLPTAPGLWPAFWLMPDRGKEAGALWKRRGTHAGGMEFDVLEYLTRYGPNRTNLAFHWDGYEKDHKKRGSDAIYFQPDADGFVTAGLLWEPGRASYYLQGREVLRWESPRIASVPCYLILTNVSGGWGGNQLTGKNLPDDFIIDYVKVWQKQ